MGAESRLRYLSSTFTDELRDPETIAITPLPECLGVVSHLPSLSGISDEPLGSRKAQTNRRRAHSLRLFRPVRLGRRDECAIPGQSARAFSTDLPDDAGRAVYLGRCAAVSGHVLLRERL